MYNEKSMASLAFVANTKKKEKTFWLNRMSGQPQNSSFPYDYERESSSEYSLKTIEFQFPEEISRQFIRLSKGNHARLFTFLTAGVFILLWKYTGKTDLLLGIPVSRPTEVVELLNQALPIRFFIEDSLSFPKLLSRLGQTLIEAEKHQNFPVRVLSDLLGLYQEPGEGFPLFDIVVSLNNIHQVSLSDFLPSLMMIFENKEKGIKAGFTYNSGRYRSGTITRLINHYQMLLGALLESPQKKLSDIDLLSTEERRQISEIFNDTNSDFPETTSVHQLIDRQAEQTPHVDALVYKEQRYSYSQLKDRTDGLAMELMQKGVGQDNVVAVIMEHIPEMVVALVGILKLGAAYLPIAPDYPQERIEYILKDSEASLVINQKFFGGPGGDFSKKPPGRRRHVHHSGHLAYIMYTSGSTGKPKGVMINHRSFIDFTAWAVDEFEHRPGYQVLLSNSYASDGSIQQIFPPLISGGTLHLIDKELRLDVARYLDYIKDHRINNIDEVPVLMKELVALFVPDDREEKLPHLTCLSLGSEYVPIELVRKCRQHLNHSGRIINAYGPAEASVETTTYHCDGTLDSEQSLIGKPRRNIKVFILDGNGLLCPIGVRGEICISGVGLARGYLNRPELTAEKFCIWQIGGSFRENHHLTPRKRFLYRSSKIYHTGDLGCWLPDGNIRFFGRIDDQIKIRGYRVELQEIEFVLKSHKGIKDAVVITRESNTGEIEIYAYYISKSVTKALLQEYLEKRLPSYMIPSHLLELEKIPLTPNGKVDKNALPSSDVSYTGEYIPPRNKLEEKLVEIWSQVLNRPSDTIGIHTDFFKAGGHSLKVVKLTSKIQKQLEIDVSIEQIFKTPTIIGLAENLKSTGKGKFTSIEPVELRDYYELTPVQKRLYILQQIEPDNTVYNIPVFLNLTEPIGEARLTEIFNRLIQRHEILRTSFTEVNQKLVQRIHTDVKFEIDGHHVTEDGAIPAAGSFIHPFDLSKAPLLRIGLIRDKDKYILAIDMHHIICDPVSHEVLLEEFNALSIGESLPLMKLQYKDYAGWQNSDSQKAKIKLQEKYWLNLLSGDLPVLELPLDFPRPQIQSFEGDSVEFSLGTDETQYLKDVTRHHNVTLFMIILGILNLLLSKLSGNEDILVGIPISTRQHEDIEKMIGMFVNTLTLRNEPAGHKTFGDFLQEVKVNTSSAYSNAEYPFEKLVEKIVVNRDASRNPLFDVIFNHIKEPGVYDGESGAETNVSNLYKNSTSKFDFTLTAVESDDTLLFNIEYCTRLFKTETIERIIGYFRKIISAVIENPGQYISQLEIISEEEKNRLLFTFNDGRQKYPNNKTIHELFTRQVEQTPNHTSLIGKIPNFESQIPKREASFEGHLSYNQLNDKADQLADVLIKKGVQADTIVGIMVERSIEMIIGILGILKSGGAYLPIDPDSPKNRIDYMLKDSGVNLLLAEGESSHLFEVPSFLSVSSVSSVAKKFLPATGSQLPERGKRSLGEQFSEPKDGPKDLLRLRMPSDSLAYIIYTSGSTGRPKGVPITHANFSPLIHWGYRHIGIEPNDRALQNVSYFFDWSVWEIFITLTSGASLYLVNRDVIMNPDKCIDFILIHMLTILHITPGQLSYLLHTGKELKTLRYLFVGAEKLTYDLAKRSIKTVEPECRIFNMYGPTEATIVSAAMEIDRSCIEEYRDLSSVPIGKSLGNIFLWILDRYFNLCPIRVAGELFVDGDATAIGYLNNPDLTVEKFIAVDRNHRNGTISYKTFCGGPGGGFSKESPGCQRLYKTGDLARWLPDGDIEFLGRIDHQVKIRGFRIELGEIESRLLTLPGIKEAVVLAHEVKNNDKNLCGYIVTDREYAGMELNQLLSKGLPDYMIPSHFVSVEKIPLTPNGKIDRKALPKPEFKTGENYSPPRNEIEEKLVKIWSEVLILPQEKIGIDDHFFQLGGHSLKATILVSKIQKELNIQVPLAEIFKSSTIRALAKFIFGADQFKVQTIEPVEKKEYYPLSSAQKRLFIVQQMDLESTVYNMPVVMKLFGALDRIRITKVFQRLINRHEGLRTSFHILNEEPVQRIHEEVKFELNHHTVNVDGEVPSPDSFILPFDLSRAPLIRISLIKREEKKYLLMIDMNHIISDGTSLGILVKEFMMLYAGEEPEPVHIRYRDWAQWQNREKAAEGLKAKKTYWLKEFEGKMPVLNLPYDFIRPGHQDFAGEQVRFALTARQTELLNTLALREGVTLYMLLLGIYYVLLFKITGQEDIIIGTPTAGRAQAELQNIIGMFLNTLALRNFPEERKPFNIFLKEVKNRVLKAFANQEYQFDDLVDRLGIKRGGGRDPLFDVMFILQNQGIPEIQIPDLRLIPIEIEQNTTKFDLSLYAEEVEQELVFALDFRRNLFKAATISIIIDYFKNILLSVLENPRLPLEEIDITPAERRTALLTQFNQDLESEATELTAGGFFQAPLNKSLHQFKNHIAIDCEDQSLSYGELDRKTNGLSHWILREGIAPGTFIGILIQSRIDFISTMTGILKAGGVVVPLYHQLPTQRLEDMIGVIGMKYIFVDGINSERFIGQESQNSIVLLDAGKGFNQKGSIDKELPPKISYSGDQRCYIYFTSGSTGRPKPIVGKNISLLHFINWEIKTFGITGDFFVSQLSLPVFDPFLRDVFVPLLAGAKICIPRENEPLIDSEKLATWLELKRINLIHCVPTIFRLLNSNRLNSGQLKNLKYILLAGEKINPSDLVDWYRVFGDRIRLVNLYGPTETTMVKVFYPIESGDIHLERIPVGNPMIGARVIILDKSNRPCFPLQVGEIFIRTPFGSFGYYNNPGLNKEKFIINPFGSNPDDILYRTGDLGRILSDGKIDILGRIDRQVKIRGNRIELEEIERVLVNQSLVKEAVVILKGNSPGQEYLCAYITLAAGQQINGEFNPKPFTDNLKHELSNRLPRYMVPSAIHILDSIPKKIGGKVDFEKLSTLVGQKEADFIPPSTDIEKRLVKIWTDILKIDPIGITDDFFELGGNSLSVVSLEAKIRHEFSIKITVAELFKRQTVAKQAQLVMIAGKDKQESPVAIEEKEYYPLSSAQKRLYVLQQIDITEISYNISHQAILEGDLDVPEFESVFKQMVRRHDSLRTSFILVNEEPVQRIHEDIKFELSNHTVNVDGEVPSPGSFIQPFDLSQAPLIRIGLIKSGEKKYILMVDMHHIITDGMSIMILYRDIMELYHKKSLAPLKLCYKDFSIWQNRRQQRMKQENRDQFWLNQFQGEIPVLNIPNDFPRPSIKNFKGSTFTFDLGEKQTEVLKRIASTNEATLYMVLLSLINILLLKLSGQEEIVIGTPTAGRTHPDIEQIIGMFVNTLVLKNNVNGEKNFQYLLREIKKRTLECFENQEYPFEHLVEILSPPVDLSRNPLFDVMFVLQNMEQTSLEIPGLTLTPVEFEKTTARFDLNFMAYEGDKKIHFVLEYSTSLFKKETIQRFVGYLTQISKIVGENPEIPVAEIEILSQAERHKLLVEFNDTDVQYDRHLTVHEKVTLQVGKTPDNIALFGSLESFPQDRPGGVHGHITCSELDTRANRLALELRDKGMTEGTIVGILMERSVEMNIGILGILKAGGVYLPLDPDYPKNRIDYMLKDSGVNLILTEGQLSDLFELPSFLSVSSVSSVAKKSLPATGHRLSERGMKSLGEQFSEPKDGPKDLLGLRTPSASLAYIIYTSGSTGNPKGVLIGHRSLVNFITGIHQIIKIASNDVMYSLTPVCFDIFGLEIFVPLTVGAAVTVGSREEQMDVELAGKTMLRRQITVFQSTPSRLTLMTAGKASTQGLKNLKYLLVGGEAFPEYLLEKSRAITRATIYNLYGPTETTIWSTVKDLTGDVPLDIGKPIANTQIYLLDKYSRLSPLGVPGELYIGGDGLSIGYANNPELTLEKFCLRQPGALFKKTAPGPRKNFLLVPYSATYLLSCLTIYRTGDLARWLHDGNIEFLGRLDHQMKIRGFRIELGEIESCLLNYPGIKEAVVVAQEGMTEDKYLCAYFVATEPIEQRELRENLSKELPAYMLPSYFVPIETIPLTPNGKIDRKALPKPEIDSSIDYIAPRDEIETGIVYILSEILAIDKSMISVGANFFEIGMNSMSLMKFAHRLSQEYNIDIPMSILFTSPSVEGVVAYLRKGYHPGTSGRAILLNKNKADRNLFLISGDGRIYIFKELALLLEGYFNVYGVLAKGILETVDLPETRQEIYNDFLNEIKKVQAEGPYLLGGHCFGAIISYELTRILEEHKNKVTKLIFFDEPALMVDKIFDYFFILRWYNKSKHAIEIIKKYIKSLKTKLTGEGPQIIQNADIIKMGDIAEDLEARRVQVDKNYRRLLSGMTHFSRIVKTAMLVIKAEASDQDPDPRWHPGTISRLSKTKVDLVKIPGAHYTIFDPPYVSGLAEKLIENI